MQAKVSKVIPLPGIPSASGMVVLNEVIYIIGDDSPMLYRLDMNYKQLPQIELFSTDKFTSGRIPKNLKPDLEAMTLIEINGHEYLLTVGSGATPAREKAYLIDLESNPITSKEISLTNFYNQLRQRPGIANHKTLNIEAITTAADTVFMMQRGVGTATNSLLRINKTDFVNMLSGSTRELTIDVQQLMRPQLNTIQGGFSGLAYFDDRLFVTASVEDTDNPVADGEVLGSFAGIYSFGTKQLQVASLTDASGKTLPVKAESVTVLHKKGNTYTALAVTDNDMGSSELLELEITAE